MAAYPGWLFAIETIFFATALTILILGSFPKTNKKLKQIAVGIRIFSFCIIMPWFLWLISHQHMIVIVFAGPIAITLLGVTCYQIVNFLQSIKKPLNYSVTQHGFYWGAIWAVISLICLREYKYPYKQQPQSSTTPGRTISSFQPTQESSGYKEPRYRITFQLKDPDLPFFSKGRDAFTLSAEPFEASTSLHKIAQDRIDRIYRNYNKNNPQPIENARNIFSYTINEAPVEVDEDFMQLSIRDIEQLDPQKFPNYVTINLAESNAEIANNIKDDIDTMDENSKVVVWASILGKNQAVRENKLKEEWKHYRIFRRVIPITTSIKSALNNMQTSEEFKIFQNFNILNDSYNFGPITNTNHEQPDPLDNDKYTFLKLWKDQTIGRPTDVYYINGSNRVEIIVSKLTEVIAQEMQE